MKYLQRDRTTVFKQVLHITEIERSEFDLPARTKLRHRPGPFGYSAIGAFAVVVLFALISVVLYLAGVDPIAFGLFMRSLLSGVEAVFRSIG